MAFERLMTLFVAADEALLERAQDLGVQSVPSLYVGGELMQVVFEPRALRRYLMEQNKDVSITQANA